MKVFDRQRDDLGTPQLVLQTTESITRCADLQMCLPPAR
jgi:hypothetical protein